MNDRLIDLEERLAFQERSLQEFNDIVARQQRDISALTLALQALQQQVRALTPAVVASSSDESKPPHY